VGGRTTCPGYGSQLGRRGRGGSRSHEEQLSPQRVRFSTMSATHLSCGRELAGRPRCLPADLHKPR
jgi:hypothetical protein